MPCKVSWLVENRVILVFESGIVTMQEVSDTGKTVRRMIREGDAPVHVIHHPNRLESWPDLRALVRVIHRGPKRGLTIVLNITHPVHVFAVQILRDLLRMPIYVFPSLESGWAFLLLQDATLLHTELNLPNRPTGDESITSRKLN